MKRYSHKATELIFSALEDQGRSQRWLARRLQEELGGNVWEPRLSDWKAGRRDMPDNVVEESFNLLGVPRTTLSFFVSMFPNSDTITPRSDIAEREAANAA